MAEKSRDEATPNESSEFDLNNPHDHFFRNWLGDPELASGFFLHTLPKSLHSWVNDPEKLTLQDASFVSEELHGSQSDLLWKCEDPNTNSESGYIYILFEHQSKPDRMMAARMLFYIVRIWERFLSRDGNRAIDATLPFVFPIVLYQGRADWNAPLRVSDLVTIPNDARQLQRFIPDMEFELKSLKEMNLDHITPEMLRIGLSAMSLVIEGGFAQWFEKLILDGNSSTGKHTGFAIVMRYALAIASPTEREAMIEVIEEKKGKIADEARSLYEVILLEGKAEGIAEGRLDGLKEAALGMRNEGFSSGKIADILGLAAPTVEGFLDELRPGTG